MRNTAQNNIVRCLNRNSENEYRAFHTEVLLLEKRGTLAYSNDNLRKSLHNITIIIIIIIIL
jgi:hypothetical protein